LNSGYGQTECYFPTCTKPCSLCATRWYTTRTLEIWFYW